MTQHNNDIYELAEAAYKAGYRQGYSDGYADAWADGTVGHEDVTPNAAESFALWLTEDDGDEQEVKARKTLREMT